MARRIKNRQNDSRRYDSQQRNVRDISNRMVLLDSILKENISPPHTKIDRRLYHPDDEIIRDVFRYVDRPTYRRVYRRPSTKKPIKRTGEVKQWRTRKEFVNPSGKVCKERQHRRRLLFSTNRIGKGKRVAQRRRYNAESSIVCRRR